MLKIGDGLHKTKRKGKERKINTVHTTQCSTHTCICIECIMMKRIVAYTKNIQTDS